MSHSNWEYGLTERQKKMVKSVLPNPRIRLKAGDASGPRAGWSVLRSPTTIHPPTTLRILQRDRNRKLIQVFSITENGVTKGVLFDD